MDPFLPLSRYKIVTTTRDDEAADVISRSLVPVRIAKIAEPQRFRLDMTGRRLGRIFIGFNQFAVDTAVDPGCMEDAVVFGLACDPRRPSYYELDEERVRASTSTAVVMSPTRHAYNWRPGRSGMIGFRIAKTVLAERYEEITGKAIRSDIVHSPSVDLEQGKGRLLRELVYELVRDLDGEASDSAYKLRWAALEDALISVLLSLPSNHSHALEAGHPEEIAPWVVRRAEDYIAAHVANPVTLSDLVAVCGCSRSMLYEAFRSSRGYTPLQFLASRRLERARERLMQEPGATATEIALDCGFGNHGRFAKAYRRRFSESPSETRARCHGPLRL